MRNKKVLTCSILIISMISTLLFGTCPVNAAEDGMFNSNVVGYWEFNGGSVTDISNHGNNGSLASDSGAKPSSIDGVDKEGLNFTGSNYVVVPNSQTLNFGTGDMSVLFWLKTTNTSSINTILDKRDSSGKGYHICLYQGRMLFQIADSSGAYNYYNTSNPVINDGKWHCCAFILDRDNTSGLNFYLDGQLLQTFNPTNRAGDITNSANLLIGRHKNLMGNFVGAIDELGIYNKALDNDDICDFYTNGICSLYSGARGYFMKETQNILLDNLYDGMTSNEPLESVERIITLGPGQKYQQQMSITKKTSTTLSVSAESSSTAGIEWKILKASSTFSFKGSWSQTREITISDTVQLNYEFPFSELDKGYNSFTIYSCVRNNRYKVKADIYQRQYRTYYSLFGLIKHTYETTPKYITSVEFTVRKPKIINFGIREKVGSFNNGMANIFSGVQQSDIVIF